MVLVMAVPADGAMTFDRILYFLPSRARVRVRPVIAAFAVEYCANKIERHVLSELNIRNLHLLGQSYHLQTIRSLTTIAR